jgi:hypothetical protein
MTLAIDQLANSASEDVQEFIAASADFVPNEVWQALEASEPFLESQQRLPQWATSMTGTGGVF